jgi:hypothetical protein
VKAGAFPGFKRYGFFRFPQKNHKEQDDFSAKHICGLLDGRKTSPGLAIEFPPQPKTPGNVCQEIIQ